eukprot:504690-Alexandrium_andersonii.AAC.1
MQARTRAGRQLPIRYNRTISHTRGDAKKAAGTYTRHRAMVPGGSLAESLGKSPSEEMQRATLKILRRIFLRCHAEKPRKY